MYPSSTPSSSQSSMSIRGGGGGNGSLMRYGSAPGSLLATAADSVIATTRDFSSNLRPFPSEPTPNPNDNISRTTSRRDTLVNGLQPPYGFPTHGGAASSSLGRPAGFIDQLATSAVSNDNGFSMTRGVGSYNSHEGIADSSGGIVSRLNFQLDFTRQEAPSRVSEESWDSTNTKMFTVESSKRANSLDIMESQFQFGMPESALETATMEKLLHIPQDSVTCKIRAKRGFATHPRSIAERERRTRISGKLKKLQDLVPNMDKQTSYADMLDLAVQHINSLQDQVQKLNEELDNCTCGCKKRTPEHT